MPAPLAAKAVPGTGGQAGATDTRARAAVTAGRGLRQARALLLWRSARPARTAPPAPACQVGTGRAWPEICGDPLQLAFGLLRRVPTTARSYRDPLFERPDLVEDDYYRLRNYPRG
jgi:hypothetical protein